MSRITLAIYNVTNSADPVVHSVPSQNQECAVRGTRILQPSHAMQDKWDAMKSPHEHGKIMDTILPKPNKSRWIIAIRNGFTGEERERGVYIFVCLLTYHTAGDLPLNRRGGEYGG